jgi:hypothetical protein
MIFVSHRVSDPMTGTKDELPADTINCFCISDGG